MTNIENLSWAALLLFGVYFLVAFIVRSLIQWRRTGDTGFRGFSRVVGSADWWAGVLFVAALVTGVLGPASALAGLDPVPALTQPALQAIGVAVSLTGICLTFLTQMQMGESWRVGVDEQERTQLVTTGVFSLVRNPIFTAMLTTGLGLALMVPTWPALAGWAMLLVAVELQVRVVEEPYLTRTHSTPYRDYMARVGRFLPGIGLAAVGARPSRRRR